MSKYTYHIAFNVSDYTQVYPENSVKVSGEWENDSWIDRVSVDELKLHREGNETVYDQLETWVIDPTKYNTECFFKIQKSSVDWLTFVFGVRWGTIDTETCVYKFKPTAYDTFYRYWSLYLSDVQDLHNSTATNYVSLYDDTSTDKPFTDWLTRLYTYYNYPDIITLGLATTGLTYKSTILNNTATSVFTILTTNGIVKDYVTGNNNHFLDFSVGFKAELGTSGVWLAIQHLEKITINQILDFLKLFQIYPFFEDATTVRLEHVFYMLTQLQDNAVSLTLADDEKQIEYLDKSAPFMEKLIFDENLDNTDTDFTVQEIKYTPSRTGFSDTEITQTYNGYSDVNDFYLNASDYSNNVLIAGTQNHVLELTASSGGWTLNENTFFFDTFVTVTTYLLKSNDIEIGTTGAGGNFSCVVDITKTGTFVTLKAYLIDRSSGALISNEQALTDGVNTFVLTPTDTPYDGVFVIEVKANTGAEITGYATCINEIFTNRHIRIPWETGAISGTPKSNGPFSQANIVNNWWDVYRPTNSATVNGSAKTFTDSQFIIRRQLKKRYWPDDINMQYGINDGSHIAKIERYTRDLDSDFVEFTLIYQEYE